MALISRQTKSGSGTKNFIDGVGKTILSSEVNLDLNTLYDEFNGSIDNANIKALAGILGTKLNLTNHITDAMVNASADIQGSKLKDASVDGDKLIAGSVDGDRLAAGWDVFLDPVESALDGPGTVLSALGAWTDINDIVQAYSKPAGADKVHALVFFQAPILIDNVGGGPDAGDYARLWMRVKGNSATAGDFFSPSQLVAALEGSNDVSSTHVAFHHVTLMAVMLLDFEEAYTFEVQYYKAANGMTADFTLAPSPAGEPAEGTNEIQTSLKLWT